MYPADLRRFSGALLLPQPLTFHKPRPNGGGVALKLNLKFDFEFGGEGEVGFLKKARGGLFLDFAQQGPANPSGDATFKWTDRATLVTAKLGQPDLSGLLVARDFVRNAGEAVPPDLRPQARDGETAEAQQRKLVTAAFTHRSLQGVGEARKEATTIVSYQFQPQGGVFRVSKSRELFGQVQLRLSEEYRFFRYLELALDTVLRVGGR